MASKIFSLLLLLLSSFFSYAFSIGVNYGAIADNLPPPPQVANFIKTQTFIDRVKLFDCNPDFIRAFANTGISLAITAANGDVVGLSDVGFARDWVNRNVAPFVPATNITMVFAGNEVLHWGDQNMKDHLVSAMRTLKSALTDAGFPNIRVSTPHSLAIMATSEPPSSARFKRGYRNSIFRPLLQYHKDTNTPFVVNVYPYFGYGYNPARLNYATFRPNHGVHDPVTKITYFNLFDAQMDAVHTAMKKLGFGDVEIVVGETGWPTVGEPGQVGADPQTAAAYNGGLVEKYNKGKGTPLMPGKKFEMYIFALFNENQKPGPIAEKNWGLFRPDFSAVYNAGILRNGGTVHPAPKPSTGKQWCIPKVGVDDKVLQSNIDYVCSTGLVDCKQIQNGGSCFVPETLQNHAAYAMNAYYQASGRHDCDFKQSGMLTASDPSFGTCKLNA